MADLIIRHLLLAIILIMSAQKVNPRITALLTMMVAVALVRVLNSAQLTPFANFSPIGAMALFGGRYFTNKWKAFLFPIVTLLISDIVINTVVFKGVYGVMYSGWYWVYIVFALIVVYGKTFIKKVSIKNVLGASIIAALSHWLIADFSVWLGGGTDLRTMTPLSKDWAGLVQCYAQGFPFMRNFMLGTIVYSGVLFGAFEWMQSRYPALRLAPAKSL